jgi:hypothetical protein
LFKKKTGSLPPSLSSSLFLRFRRVNLKQRTAQARVDPFSPDALLHRHPPVAASVSLIFFSLFVRPLLW